MEIQLQITSRNIELSEAIRSEITKKAEKLDKFHERITRCRVVVEAPHRHHHQGIKYSVNINMTVPGGELIVKKQSHEDLYVAIRDSFNAAKRKLEDFARRQRGDVKQHEEVPLARISSLFPEQGYGFITTEDNQEIYFHENSVLNQKFDRLTLGMEVRCVEEQGEKGPQASTVTVI
jgi:ribosomal subunit interface protein